MPKNCGLVITTSDMGDGEKVICQLKEELPDYPLRLSEVIQVMPDDAMRIFEKTLQAAKPASRYAIVFVASSSVFNACHGEVDRILRHWPRNVQAVLVFETQRSRKFGSESGWLKDIVEEYGLQNHVLAKTTPDILMDPESYRRILARLAS